ncbi:hypothetical protein Taro_050167, partial [Colocasia esculenta]|nr:hypothetical protein [Colocasia esculenta]
WFSLPPGVEHGGASGGSCGAWSGVKERGGGVLAIEKTPLGFGSLNRIPAVGLPSDVATAVRVVTSEEASLWSGATLSRHGGRNNTRLASGVSVVSLACRRVPQSRVSLRTFWWLAFQQGRGVSCRRVLLLLLGARALTVVTVFARAAVGFILGLHVRVVVSQRLREPTCGVAFTGAGLWSAEPVEVVNSGEVLPEFFSVGSGGSEVSSELEGFSVSGIAFVLVEVFRYVEVHRLVALCSGDVFPDRLVVVLVRLALRTVLGLTVSWWFWWRFSQNQFVLLLLAAMFFSRLAMCFGRLLGLRSGNVSWRFWWRFSTKLSGVVLAVVALSLCGDELSLLPVGLSAFSLLGHFSQLHWWDFVCPYGRVVCFASRSLPALPDGGLRPVVCLLSLLSVGCSGWWCFHMAFGAVSCTVATFVAKVLVDT